MLQVWESASKTVQEEEAIKQKLCEDLSKLVNRLLNKDILTYRPCFDKL